MKITENLMLGKLLLNRPVYEALEVGSFKPVLCTDVTNPSSIQTFSQFTDGTYHPWNLQRSRKAPTITDTKAARHKVYTEEELEFSINYEELEDISLDVLQYLAEDYRRCSFVVSDSTFLKLFSQLAMFTGSFKYNSNVYNRENCFSRLAQNAVFVISIYKLDTFIFDLYGNKPNGYGISFEIVDKFRSGAFPEVNVGYYILLTDAYEGVFYVDGRSAIQIKSTDFKAKYEYFKHVVKLCGDEPIKKFPKTYTTSKSEVDWEKLVKETITAKGAARVQEDRKYRKMSPFAESMRKKVINTKKQAKYAEVYGTTVHEVKMPTTTKEDAARAYEDVIIANNEAFSKQTESPSRPFRGHSNLSAEKWQDLEVSYARMSAPDTNDLDFDVGDLEINHIEFSNDDGVEVVPEEVQPEPAPVHKKKNQDPRHSMADRHIKTARKSSRSNTVFSQATFATVYQDNFSTIYQDTY